MRKTKLAMLQSVVALILCAAMLVGTTFAWFTDEVTSAVNKIQAGNLDVDLVDAAGNSLEGTSLTFMDVTGNTDILWEPGCTFKTQGFRVANRGSLALEYTMYINGLLGDSKLLEVIRFSVQDADGYTVDIDTFEGQLSARASSDVFYLVGHMDENAGNEYMNLTLTGIGITVYATQAMEENDSFGPEYDKDAFFPGLDAPILGSVNITTENDLLTADAYIDVEGAKVTIPAGTRVEPGTTTLKLRVKLMDETTSDVKLSDNQVLQPMDVTVEGVSDDNQVPLTVELYEIAPVGLNMGSIALHHVHDGTTVTMTRVAADAAFTADNQYRYDPATGDLALHMATFSEVAVVADTENAWEGNVDHSWYDADATELTIANADQLWSFSQIVGGMAKDEDGNYIYTASVAEGKEYHYDSFAGKTIKLVADINLGDDEEHNNPDIIFYPIGYWNNEETYERKPLEERTTAVSSGLRNFAGTFDGNGHTVSNFYQNTWEMKGDHDWYSPEEQYYRDGMGLFGRVYKGTVKNLTIKNFSSDGEITTTGCVAAYADGATFENIAIFNCNPRVYNIGNGGIVGCVGWYAKEAGLKTTFKNITVDNSNKISALWGSYDVACGGIVGQYYPTSGQSSASYPVNAGIHFENCHVSAVMDVYNDVCANYQYYAYRYTGMLIGSVRENETIDGHVYPKMDGITAEGCTVHFGTWNDYYYCEIIDNTTASYTHDYQMSRLTEIKAIDGTTITYLDGTTGTVPASGRANYVIVDYTKGHGTENATCYHFKDGAVWTHDMGGIQTGIDENGDGQDDLKEDKQHIYLEFNNLVTGYGWGVTSKGVGDLAGVTILDREVGNSVVKFEKADTAKDSYMTEKTITIGELFKKAEWDDTKLTILNAAISVTVSPVGEGSTAGGTFVKSTTEKWEDGTLTFSGIGAATITITDYYFCTATTISVTITPRTAEEKFDVVMNNGNFLHRVGNVGTVALDKLFKANGKASIGKVTVTVEPVNGTAASGTYTPSATWTNGTIQFSGTGVVKVTIKDDDKYCTPTVLYLEVVDAKNATTATDAKENNVVLLQNITASSLTVSDGWAFYGNGFEIKFDGDGSYRSAAVSYGFITLKNGGTLDNTRVICKVFPKSYMFTSEMTAGSDGRYPYGYSAIIMSDNSTVSNCYVYGARNNILVSAGDALITNTVTECGSLSNIQVLSSSSSTVTLDDVTTIQYQTTSPFDDSAKVLGFGVVVGLPDSTSNATIKLVGDFNQYNWVTNENTAVSNTYTKSAIEGALKVSKYQHTNAAGATTVNTGIAYMNSLGRTVIDERTNTDVKYEGDSVSISGYTGYVYSIVNKTGNPDAEINRGQFANGAVAPKVTYNSKSESDKLTTAFDTNTNRWVNTLMLDLDALGSYTFSFSDLIASKYGISLDYEVKDANGNAVNKATAITLSQLHNAEYTLVVTDNQIYNNKGELTGPSVKSEVVFVIHATKTSIEPPKFTGIGTGSALKTHEKSGIKQEDNWRPAYRALEGVSVTYWSASEGKTVTIALSELNTKGSISGNIWTYTCNDYTLTITGGTVHTDGSKISPKVVNGVLYFWSADKAFGTGTTSRDINLTYTFTDKNASTTESMTQKVQFSALTYYKKSEFEKGNLVEGKDGGGCVTPDTLVTLADGTQKRIDEVTYADQLLVWNFYTGEYDAVPSAIILNHGYDTYNVVTLKFSDGTKVRIINDHGFFDADTGRFVILNELNVADYIGHNFVKQDGDGYATTELLSYSVETEQTESWGILTAGQYNCIVAGMWTLVGAEVPGAEDYLMPFEVGADMKYDEAKMQADIEKYGLYTYEDFAQYMTEEQFVALGLANWKVSVGKGYITYEDILDLAKIHLG